jgi:hypothetical protein
MVSDYIILTFKLLILLRLLETKCHFKIEIQSYFQVFSTVFLLL